MTGRVAARCWDDGVGCSEQDPLHRAGSGRSGADRESRLSSGGSQVSEPSAGTVGRRPVLDAKDDDQSFRLIDLVDDAIHAASSRSHSGQFTLQYAAETVRAVDERTEHELDDRRGGPFGKSAELAFRRPGDSESVRGLFVAHFVK